MAEYYIVGDKTEKEVFSLPLRFVSLTLHCKVGMNEKPKLLTIMNNLRNKRNLFETRLGRILIGTTALCASLLFSVNASAKVRLPHVLSDGMVLQQQSDARLWGWAKAGKTVTVAPSWTAEKYNTKAGKDGRFEIRVKTPAASFTPLSISFDDGEGAVTVGNILSGEVWVCAGQSNMEMPVMGFGNCPVQDYNNVVADAVNNRGLRFCKIPSVTCMTPRDDADCRWLDADIQNVSNASATGYFFGRMLSRTLNIPVGLIEANKGGSRVESWLNKENCEKYTDENLDSVAMVRDIEYDYYRPMVWGNGTFNPIQNYTVKGILFYQGCSNVGYHTPQYAFRLSKLVEQWRKGFGEGDIPFYLVQIAPFDYGPGIDGAKLREQQVKALSLIPNSDIVCTNDLVYPYEKGQIHPTQKRQVGERLAFIALNHNYGFTGIRCESAQFDKMDIVGDTCFIKLKNDYGGVSRYDGIEGFEVAGSDKVFHKAEAKHFWVPGNNKHNEWIAVISKDVAKPVAVRYCFKNFQIGNLKNQALLPLIPFRTDEW